MTMADERPVTAAPTAPHPAGTGATLTSPPHAPVPSRRPSWERRLAGWLHLVDLLGIVLAAVLAELLLPGSHPALGAVGHLAVLGGLSALWLTALSVSGAYESHTMAQGPDEYRRLLVAAWHFAAIIAVAALLLRTTVSPSFLLLGLTLGVVLLFAGRHGARRVLWAQRTQGRAMHKLLVVGPPYRSAEIIERVSGVACGFEVVGVCTSGLVDDALDRDLPALGFTDFGDIVAAVKKTGADTVAVVGENDMPTGFIRQLAWELEGTGVDLMVSPAITDIAGPRIHIRPVAQLPMLYVESPHARGLTRLVKAFIDPLAAALLLLVVSPVLLVIAALIKIDSPGPVFFRQQRAGHNANYFRIWKFRTMRPDAERMAESYELERELDNGRGKSAGDPRITRIGTFLRKTSLDELPQLINVLQGTMSLVGPRPVPADLDTFEHHELRRLLVRPGMTGLWQVSGRSDLDWEERVRLDLYYVENWSPLLDLVILLRTVSVVLRGSGAY